MADLYILIGDSGYIAEMLIVPTNFSVMLFCYDLKGVCAIPSREVMWRDIGMKQKSREQHYLDTQRHSIRVDWIPYMDELAEMIGCKPHLGEPSVVNILNQCFRGLNIITEGIYHLMCHMIHFSVNASLVFISICYTVKELVII